jgi:hypothetical protein
LITEVCFGSKRASVKSAPAGDMDVKRIGSLLSILKLPIALEFLHHQLTEALGVALTRKQNQSHFADRMKLAISKRFCD